MGAVISSIMDRIVVLCDVLGVAARLPEIPTKKVIGKFVIVIINIVCEIGIIM